MRLSSAEAVGHCPTQRPRRHPSRCSHPRGGNRGGHSVAPPSALQTSRLSSLPRRLRRSSAPAGTGQHPRHRQPGITPTNLVFNVAATRGGLLRLWPERRLTGSLTSLLVAGTLPGVIAGAVIRVELLSSSRAFMWVAAGVLLPLGLWLIVGSQRIAPTRPQPTTRASILISVLALLVGCAGASKGSTVARYSRQSYWRSASPRVR